MSKENIILNYLTKVGPLTQKGAINLCAAYRLSAVIYSLKKKGHEIETELVTTSSTPGSAFAKYRIVQ